MNWFPPIRGQHPSMDELVNKFAMQMQPKPGKNINKVLAEINRQRCERLDKAERLRLEATALLHLANKIMNR